MRESNEMKAEIDLTDVCAILIFGICQITFCLCSYSLILNNHHPWFAILFLLPLGGKIAWGQWGKEKPERFNE